MIAGSPVLPDRRQNVVNYMNLDEQKLSHPNPSLQLIKDSLAEMGK